MIVLFPLKRDTIKHATFWKYNAQLVDHTYNPYSSSEKLVVNSNSLQLIQDEELQEYLVSWKDVLLDYQEEEIGYYKMVKDHIWPHWREVLDYSESDKEMNLACSSPIAFQNLMIDKRNYLRVIIKAKEEDALKIISMKLSSSLLPKVE